MPRHPHGDTSPRVWPRRLAWLLGIWSASVAALALAAWLMRLLFRSVGLA